MATRGNLDVSVPPKMVDNRKSVVSGFNTQKGYLKDAFTSAKDLEKTDPERLRTDVYQRAMADALTRLTEQFDKVKTKFALVSEQLGDEDAFFKTAENEVKTFTAQYREAVDALRTLIATNPPAQAAAPAAAAAANNGNVQRVERNVDKSVLSNFKPHKLGPDESFTNFIYWKEKFMTYFRLTRIDSFQVQDQQIALFGCLDEELEKKVRMSVKDTTPVSGNDSVMEELENIFRTMNPIHARRQSFFDAMQGRGQSMSAFMADLDALAGAAELADISSEQLQVYRLIAGCQNPELRKKIMEKEVEPTMQSLVATVNAYEAARNATPGHHASVVTGKSRGGPRRGQKKGSRGHQRGKSRGRSRARSHSANSASSVRCWRCGNSSHTRDKCTRNAEDFVCDKCHKTGHVKSVCGAGMKKKGRFRSQSRNRSFSPRNRQNRGRSRHRSKSNQRYEGNAIMHGSNAAQGGMQPTPRVVVRVRAPGRGTVKFVNFTVQDAMPDSGATCTIISRAIVDENLVRFSKDSTEEIRVADGSMIPVRGTVEIHVTYHDKTTTVKALVCDNLAPTDLLIGWQQCVALGILSQQFPLPVAAACEPDMAITEAECKALEAKILKEYSDVLRDELRGETIRGSEMTITLKDDKNVRPLCISTAKATPIHYKAEAEKVVKNLLAEDIIERVPPNEPSKWCSLGFFVPKPNSDAVRLVTDFRILNQMVERAPKPFASTKEIIRNLPPGSSCFAKLDAVNGYYQLPLAKESRPYTTFILESGRYRYKRGPMGLCATGDAFCEATDRAFENQPGTQKIVDDGLTCAKSVKELEERLRKVLNLCRSYNICLSRKKFAISTKVKFAGHIISHKGVQPDPEKVAAIRTFPRPTNLTEVRSFLGLANQLGYFVPDLTHVCRPIHELTKKDIAFNWGLSQEKAFEEAKEILTGDLLVNPFDPKLPTELYTDASRQGLGYVLAQRGIDGKISLVRCGSRALTSAETRYAVTELECLAVCYAVKHCEFYLAGASEITVITDHRALVGLWNKQLAEVPNARVLRYRERLLNFNLKIVWKPGKSHAMADALSRDPRFGNPATDYEAVLNNDYEEINEDANTILAVFVAAAELDPQFESVVDGIDNEYKEVIKAVEDCKLPETLSHWKKCFYELSLVGTGANRLLIYDTNKLVIPQPARKEIINMLHISHSGVRKTQALANRHVYWPNMANDIANACDQCSACKSMKPKQQREPANRKHARRMEDTFPMSDVGVDLFEAAGATYLVMVDRYSGFPFCCRLTSTTTAAVIQHLKTWWCQEGIPCRIRTDGGPQFRQPFQEFCKSLNVQHELASAYNPESNGLAENAVKTCKHLLLKCKEDKEDFELALLAWRTTPPSPKKASPAQLFRHRDLKIAGIPKSETSLQYFDSDQLESFVEERQKQFDATLDQIDKRARKNKSKDIPTGTTVDIFNSQTGRWNLEAGEVEEKRDPGDSYVIRDKERNTSFLRGRNLIRPSLPKGVYETPPESEEEEESAPDAKRRKKEDFVPRRSARLRFKQEDGREENSEREREKATKRATRMVAFISQDPTFEGVTSPLPSDQAVSNQDLDKFVPIVCAISNFGRAPPPPKTNVQRLIDLAQEGGPPSAERLIQIASESDGSGPLIVYIKDGTQIVPFPTKRIKTDDTRPTMDQGTGPPPPAAADAAKDEDWPDGEWQEDDEPPKMQTDKAPLVDYDDTSGDEEPEVLTLSSGSEHGGPSRPPSPAPQLQLVPGPQSPVEPEPADPLAIDDVHEEHGEGCKARKVEVSEPEQSPPTTDTDDDYAWSRTTALKVLLRALFKLDHESLGCGTIDWPSSATFSRAPLLPLLRLYANSYFVPKHDTIFEEMRQSAMQDRRLFHEHRLHGRGCKFRAAVLRGSRRHYFHQPGWWSGHDSAEQRCVLNTYDLEKRAFVLEDTVLSEAQIWAFFEATRKYVVAKSQDREVVLEDMYGRDLSREPTQAAISDALHCVMPKESQIPQNPQRFANRRRGHVEGTYAALTVVRENACDQHWCTTTNILDDRIPITFEQRRTITISNASSCRLGVLKLLYGVLLCLPILHGAQGQHEDALWVQCDKQHDRGHFLEECRDACYQGIAKEGHGDPCRTVLGALYDAETDRDRFKAEVTRLDEQVNELHDVIDDKDHKNQLDELRRQIQAIKSAREEERAEDYVRHRGRHLQQQPAGQLAQPTTIGAANSHVAKPPSRDAGEDGISAIAGAGIVSAVLAAVGLVVGIIKAARSKDGTRSQRAMQFVRDPETHASIRDIAAAVPRSAYARFVGRPDGPSSVNVHVHGADPRTDRRDPRDTEELAAHRAGPYSGGE